MDFFKSVFSEDTDPSDEEQKSPSHSPKSQDPHQESTSDDTDPNAHPNPTAESPSTSRAGGAGAWNFGGLIKTLAPVIETYKRDLEEFGSGLKKETSIIRDVASRAVKELPSSIEVGASVAQESIESVGHVIDEFGSSVWRGTSEIIANSKEAILDLENQSDSSSSENRNVNSNVKHYSRFEMQIQAIQSDVSTYTEQPDDLDDYGKWKAGFVGEEQGEEIENLLEENAAVEDVYNRIVPSVVDGETFWSRYFYRVYKLKQVEDARANLVKRAISGEDEDLSWDVDDDDSTGYEADNDGSKINDKINIAEPVAVEKEDNEESSAVDAKNEIKENVENPVVEFVLDDVSTENVVTERGEKSSDPHSEELVVSKSDEKSLPGKTDHGESSSKGSEVPVVVSQPSGPEEEDIEWDEIEDIDSQDDKKVTSSGSPNKTDDLRKRLSVHEDEEDLSWDIEDDDEPVKH